MANEMGSAPDELLSMFTQSSELKNYFSRSGDHNELTSSIERFLRSTMDEVRLRNAEDCANRILRVADLHDLGMLREGVQKREASGSIAFQGHRDHTAHTLNNWLLGWYIYSKCDKVKDALSSAIEARHWPKEKFGHDEYFGHIWQYVSLLHDVGYLFEGSLGTMDPATQSAQASVGVRILDDYFNARLWRDAELSSIHDQRQLFNELGFQPPEFRENQSLARIAFSLRDLGDLRDVQAWLSEPHEGGKRPGDGASTPTLELPGDAFELWKQHFNAFGYKEAADRIGKVEDAFEWFVFRGLPKICIRVLDHAVCSGLTLLKIATVYYSLMAKVTLAGRNEAAPDITKKVLSRPPVYDYDPEFWWTGIVWATAATAVHNIQQMETPWYEDVKPKPLTIDEDPLSYLGILVDCIQEWDRYFVFALPDRMPVQGIDVKIGVVDGKLVVDLGTHQRAKSICSGLDKALHGWTDFVQIRP